MKAKIMYLIFSVLVGIATIVSTIDTVLTYLKNERVKNKTAIVIETLGSF